MSSPRRRMVTGPGSPSATTHSADSLLTRPTGVITAAGGTTTLAVTAAGSDILLGTQANNFGASAPVFGGTVSNIRDVSLRNTNAGATLPSFAGLTGLRNLTVAFDNAAGRIGSVEAVKDKWQVGR